MVARTANATTVWLPVDFWGASQMAVSTMKTVKARHLLQMVSRLWNFLINEFKIEILLLQYFCFPQSYFTKRNIKRICTFWLYLSYLGIFRSVKFRMNLRGHRFSQNANQKFWGFLPYPLINFQGRNP